MNLIKVFRDKLSYALSPREYVPEGLLEMSEYFRQFGPINFDYGEEDGLMIAVSSDYKCGSIVTSGRNERELDRNIKDAIFTSFEVPSVYSHRLEIKKVGEKKEGYALAK